MLVKRLQATVIIEGRGAQYKRIAKAFELVKRPFVRHVSDVPIRGTAASCSDVPVRNTANRMLHTIGEATNTSRRASSTANKTFTSTVGLDHGKICIYSILIGTGVYKTCEAQITQMNKNP